MVAREEALEMLERARDYEEKLIKDIETVFDQMISRMRLSPEQDELMRAFFRKLVSDSERHEEMFVQLIGYVKEGGRNAY